MMYCAMRRKDREVTSLDQILDILQRCDTAHLAMSGEDGPYVVPVSFGFEARQENVLLYFHGQNRGTSMRCLHAISAYAWKRPFFTAIAKRATVSRQNMKA